MVAGSILVLAASVLTLAALLRPAGGDATPTALTVLAALTLGAFGLARPVLSDKEDPEPWWADFRAADE